MTRLTLCLTMLLSLILAAQATAKEVVSAKVCGASDCREVKDEKSLMAMAEGGPPTDPPKASGFYRADLTVKGDQDETVTFRTHLVPAAGVIRGEDGTWMPVSDRAVAVFRRVTRGLEAIPAARFGALQSPPLPEPRVDDVVEAPQQPVASASGNAPVWPWIAGGLAVLIILGIALTWRGRGLPGARAVRSRP